MKPPPITDAVDLLDRLLSGPAPVSASALASELHRPITAIHAALAQLREAGCRLDEHPHLGVRLVESSIACWADFIEHRHRDRLGRRLIVYRQTASTQEIARALVAVDGHAAAGAVVVADHQTAGRGRLGRRWFDAPGRSLALTAIVPLGELTADRLALASCCAVTAAVESLCACATQIRWPNDVLIDGRKLAGILIETAAAHALIGIGVNHRIDPGDLPADDAGRAIVPAAIADTGASIDRLRLLDTLLDELQAALAADDDSLRRRWLERSCLAHQRLRVESDGRRLTGRVIDIDPHHGLIIQLDTGPVVTLPAATTSLV